MSPKNRSFWGRIKDTAYGYHCYISFARNDGAQYAQMLAAHLGERGVKCFMDIASLSAGTDLQSVIQDALRQSRAIIFIGTRAAFASDWVRLELETFRRFGEGRIIPIIFDPSLVRGEHGLFWLRDILWLQEDASALLTGPSDKAIASIIVALEHVQRPPLDKSPKDAGARPFEEKRALNEGKLILVGRGEVGKTSVVNGLVHSKFRGDEGKTQGINITNWDVPCGAVKVRLNIWDFGGQEIMHATHQFFLTARSLYLLVISGRGGAEDEDAEYWLKHVETFGGESPVIVVQNKITEHPFDLNYRGLRSRYPQIRAFVKTDCKSRVGLGQLSEQIQAALNDMPQVRMQFSIGWFRVKRSLEIMNEDFMGYETFLALCREQGVNEDSDRETLGLILHCLGIALNYRDDSRLRETSVLKPEWVTQGIYQILNTKELAQRHGELQVTELGKILPKKRYPIEKHTFLLELMRKFSLCFPFPDDVDRYLVPELLGKEEPREVAEFPPAECLNFEYHYAVLPEGLIPRFIVRSHTLSRGQKRWRFGAILSHEDCRALVKSDPGDRRVAIRVKGGDGSSRRRLLAIVRYDLDRINGEFKDRLEVNPKVPLTDHPEFAVDYRKLVAFEKQGVNEFPEFVGTNVINVRVDELLNGVDLESERDVSLAKLAMAKSVFFSYSHKDESLRDELEVHLKLLQRQGVISAWHDRKILPGKEWNREIDSHLNAAKIILLLVSADFIASEYCWEKEVQRAVERHEAGEAIVVPISLRACDWESAPFGKLQGLPKNVKPVTAWEDRDAAWADVAKGLRSIVEAKQ